MSDEIQRLLWALDGRYGFLIAATAWLTCIRFGFKWAQGFIQEYMTKAAVETDKVWIGKLIENRWYRLICFLFDYLGSVKLPNPTVVAARKSDTVILKKEDVKEG